MSNTNFSFWRQQLIRNISRYVSDIYAYLDYLQDTFQNLVQVITIGKSSEGRELQLVRISTSESSNGSLKPAIWIDGGKVKQFRVEQGSHIDCKL